MTGDANGETNGINFDRRIRAAAAYAEVASALKDQNDRMFGNTQKGMAGALPEINAKLDKLSTNPFIRLGWFLDSAGKVLTAFIVVLAGLAAIIVAVVQVGHTVGFWH